MFYVQADQRWALSGTPIHNRLQELGPFFCFLRYSPFNTDAGRAALLSPAALREDPAGVPAALQAALKVVMLRRTRGTIGHDGVPICPLPPL